MQSQKRTACNQCRQQKLRCNLTTTEDASCSRCQKLDLECKLEPDFQRSRKRRRTVDLEDEIHALKARLADAEYVTTPTSASVKYWAPQALHTTGGTVQLPARLVNGQSHATVPRSPDHTNLSLPGITTRPHDHELQPPALAPVKGPQPRSLENIDLNEDDINGLFSTFVNHYHQYLPILDPQQPPHKVYEASPILFWCIISVAARRSEEHPLLLNQMAQPVLDLLWKTIRSPPHALGLIQSILLICTWPVPTSSSATDQSYTLAGIAISTSVQLGLHRPINQHDYVKYRFYLTDQEVRQRIQTWTACNVVAHNISIGVGLQAFSRLNDCPDNSDPTENPNSGTIDVIHSMLQIERFKQSVSNAFTANMTDKMLLLPTEGRLSLYPTFEDALKTMRVAHEKNSDYINLQLNSAELHLKAFFLSDEPTTAGYENRILSLHMAVSQFIQHLLKMDSTLSLTRYAPFVIYQLLSSGCFILLKILKNDHFSSLIDKPVSKKLFNRSISAMRRMSISNNDIPGRVSDVLAYLYNLPDPAIIGGQGQGGLEMQIRSRLSMSVVYDSLWKWRDQFRAATASAEAPSNQPSNQEESQPLDETEFDNNAFQHFTDMPTDYLFWDWFR